jgi:hypothetical protein
LQLASGARISIVVATEGIDIAELIWSEWRFQRGVLRDLLVLAETEEFALPAAGRRRERLEALAAASHHVDAAP